MATRTTPKKAAKKTTAKPRTATGASKKTTSKTVSAKATSKTPSAKPAPASASARKTAARVPGGSIGVGAKSKADTKSSPVGRKAVSKSSTGKAAVKPSPAKGTKAAARKAGSAGAESNAKSSAAAKKQAMTKSARPAKKAAAAKPTARQALAITRKLLKDKQERDGQIPAWQQTSGESSGGLDPGFQSSEARGKAQELHAGEIRLKPIHGSISTRDRRNQGKRDKG